MFSPSNVHLPSGKGIPVTIRILDPLPILPQEVISCNIPASRQHAETKPRKHTIPPSKFTSTCIDANDGEKRHSIGCGYLNIHNFSLYQLCWLFLLPFFEMAHLIRRHVFWWRLSRPRAYSCEGRRMPTFAWTSKSDWSLAQSGQRVPVSRAPNSRLKCVKIVSLGMND